MCKDIENVKINEIKSFRDLNSTLVNEMVSIKGLVHEKTNPYFKVVKTSFVCENCGTCIEILKPKERIINGFKKPLNCPECEYNSFQPLKDRSKYKLVEEIILEDFFQNYDSNQSPLSVKVLMEDGLIDSVSCGELVKIQGIVKREEDVENNKFHPIIVAKGLQDINYLEEMGITEEDQQAIIGLSEQENIHDMIMESIAPSIYGYDHMKMALALQLFGGVHKVFDEGILGGDINILIIGDPNTGKSLLLEKAAKIAPRSVYADNLKYKLPESVCKSKSDVQSHSESEIESSVPEELLCIDHLNLNSKSRESHSEEYYTEIHILHILNSLCPVLAASNPKFDRFTRFKTLFDQTDLPYSVLSKFDLIFVMEDRPIYEEDQEIAGKFLNILQKGKIEHPIDLKILKKYIIYAKHKYHPKLTDKTRKQIEKLYLRMRHSFADEFVDEDFLININLRHLETLIKFAEASARIRLSNTVNSADVKRAYNIMRKCFNDVGFDTGKINLDQWYQKSFNPQ